MAYDQTTADVIAENARLKADNKRLRGAMEDCINHLQYSHYNLAFEAIDAALAQTDGGV